VKLGICIAGVNFERALESGVATTSKITLIFI